LNRKFVVCPLLGTRFLRLPLFAWFASAHLALPDPQLRENNRSTNPCILSRLCCLPRTPVQITKKTDVHLPIGQHYLKIPASTRPSSSNCYFYPYAQGHAIWSVTLITLPCRKQLLKPPVTVMSSKHFSYNGCHLLERRHS